MINLQYENCLGHNTINHQLSNFMFHFSKAILLIIYRLCSSLHYFKYTFYAYKLYYILCRVKFLMKWVKGIPLTIKH
jgi:hypothetical protein